MDLNEKSVVKIDGDGTVVKCAKGLAGGECGYQPDTKVCGKCGAMAVEIKMVPVDEEDTEDEEMTDEDELFEEDEEEAPMENGKPMLKTKGDYLMRSRRRMVPKATRQALMQANQDGLYRPVKGEDMGMEDEEDMYYDDEEEMGMEDEKGLDRRPPRPRPPFPPPGPPRGPRGPRKPGGPVMPYKADEMMDEEEDMYMDDEGNEYMMDEEGKMYAMPSRGAGPMPVYKRQRRIIRKGDEMMNEEDEMYMDDEDNEYMVDEDGKMYTMPTSGRSNKRPNAYFVQRAGEMGGNQFERRLQGSQDFVRNAVVQRLRNSADDMMPEDEEEDMYMDDEMMEGEDEMETSPDLEAMRMARLRKLGTKSADVGMNGYLCAIDRKVYPGATSVCDDCPGGCMAEKGMPGLLHVEGLVEVMFKGDVIDSGYSQDADMYVVDVQTKSGNINEVFVDGTSAEVLGFHRLDDSVLSQKSIMDDIQLIDFNDAAEIAVKSIPGSVVAVEPAVFEGFDSYQVEINGLDGKSYDVFVALDGETLGYDSYNSDETAEIEAEAAEIALKRAFSDESRQEMAKEGTAMPDGSFPIASESDLRNAIMAHGRAKDVDAAKAHIKKRAAAMGMDAMIPEEWKSQEKSNPAEEFIQSLVEFEMLTAEVENPSTTK